ncbi:hypothetical protein GCM10022247_04770 [Allokutzneria multivorans]|uniref:Uncharacterized protein n=1 Tax=Allokutzneria multivorans TaxID=1142134 RepID=A0ABP7QWX4_9PSEU
MAKVRLTISCIVAALGFALVGVSAEAAPATPVTSTSVTAQGSWHYISTHYYKALSSFNGSNYIKRMWPAYTHYECRMKPDTYYELWVHRA